MGGARLNAVDSGRRSKAHAQATTRKLKELWAKVANDCLERTGNGGRAIREANAVVRRQAEDRYSQASPHSGHSHRSYRLTEARAEFTTEVRARSVRARTNQTGQASGILVASHFASAALTSAGRSCAIQ